MTVVPIRPVRALLAVVVAASALMTGCLFSPDETRASRGMELALQDDATFLVTGKRVTRERAFTYARQLGVTRLRVNMLWAYVMPENVYKARRKPAQVPVPVRLVRLARRRRRRARASASTCR